MENKENKDNLIGSLWVKEVGGRRVISGMLNGKRVFVVQNKNKKTDASPDFFVFEKTGNDDVTF